MKNRDALHYEYEQIQEEMRGISPKLSLYADLQKRLEDISKQMGGMKPLPIKTHGQSTKGSKKRYYSNFHHRF